MSHPPLLLKVKLGQLRPTQMTVGLREVAAKRAELEADRPPKLHAAIKGHVVPVVAGPGRAFYLTDHHHFVRALADLGHGHVRAALLDDLSDLGAGEFWNLLLARGLTHPFDNRGRLTSFARMPLHVSELADDPYRSLAAALRDSGGCAKSTQPFAEFQWADFLRERVPEAQVRDQFDAALEVARQLARSPVARHLPGHVATLDYPQEQGRDGDGH